MARRIRIAPGAPDRRLRGRPGLLAVGAAALALAAVARPRHVTAPHVPANLAVEPGHEAFLVGHAIGTQNYVCLPSGAGFAWSLFTPEATLFDDHHQPIITHYFGPNPLEGGKIRAVWQHSRDTSTVWGRAVQSCTDPHFVEAGAIPWLLVNVKDVGAKAGPMGGRELADTTFVQRVNTHGGAAPGSGCRQSADVGHQAFVPYSADYVFYEKTTRDGRHES
jgi:hypothetical protein